MAQRVTAGAAIVGREAEVAELTRFVARSAISGATRLLVGPAGVGKTRLLEEMHSIAARSGALVLATSGTEFDASMSHAGLNRLLRPLRTHLDELDSAYRQGLAVALGYAAGPPATALLVCGATLTLLERIACRQPVVVAVDDLHWLDEASLRVLSFVAQHVADSRIGFIATVRDSRQVSPRIALDGDADTDIAVQPLTDRDAEVLVDLWHPALPILARRRVLHQAQGNPLAIRELGRVLEQTPRGAGSALDHIPMTDRLKQSLSYRICDLPVETRHCLLLLALDDREDMAALRELDIHLGALVPAEDAGLVVVDQARLSIRFAHPLIRATVVEESTSEQRREAHGVIAETLRNVPSKRAWHLAEAALDVDGDTADLLEETATDALRRGDAYGCAGALARAARLSPDTDGRGRRLALAAYLHAEVIGEPVDASQHLDDFRTLPRRGPGSLHAVIATAIVYADTGGDCGSAHRMIDNAVRSGAHRWRACDSELIEVFYTWFIICWQAGVPAYWETYFSALAQLRPDCPTELLVLSRAFGDPVRLGSGVRRQLRSLIDAQPDDGDPMTTVRLNTAAVYVDLLAAGRKSTWRLIEAGRRGDAMRTYFRALMLQCLDDYVSGHWQRAQELAQEGLAGAGNTGLTTSWYFLYVQALLAAVRGDAAGAETWAAELDRTTLSREAFGIQRLSHHARALAAEAAEDWEGAYRHAIAFSPPGTFARYEPHALWLAYDVVEASLRTGRREEAIRHVHAMEDSGVAELSPRLALLVGGAAALVADSGRSLKMFEAALCGEETRCWPFDHARVQLEYGSRLRREQRLKDARIALHESLETFEAIGAHPWAVRARAELRAARDVSTVPREMPALTPQEWAIADLAARGLSNKEIGAQLYLSSRTVGGHLYRIYPKLGIGNRAALRDALSTLRSDTAGDLHQ
ncbi:ATP-binding protein [Mycolicibacterium palauense]|uniref:ATP-binding protein n=1 Tax=Mycolicibacterium palauense TaxID=2034511 RepID=UPI000BFEC32C|nr:LuxR family transcriptional regulator [Mycolicibacterium palauense]